MRTIPNLILASSSPRRRELLLRIGIENFSVIPARDELKPNQGDPEKYVLLLSAQKAGDVAQRAHEDDIILAADTIVWLEGKILEKPVDREDAERMLGELSGRKHTVYTGVTLRRGSRIESFCEAAGVFFRELGEDEIAQYVASGEPMDKAGAYGVQGIGARFVTRIDGDYSCVVGLPLSRVYLALKDFGLF